MQDKIELDKAEFNRRMKSNQAAAQALLDIDRAYIEMTLQENIDAAQVFDKLPEIYYNPFWDEAPADTVSFPATNVLQHETKQGKQLVQCILECLKQNTIPPIKENFINVGNNNNFLGFANNALLSMQMFLHEYQEAYWCSSDFIKANGYKIKAHEKPTYLCYWSFCSDNDSLSFSEAFHRIYHKSKVADRVSCQGKCYEVYNVEQLIGVSFISEDTPFSFSIDEKITKCECMIGGIGASLVHKGNVAGYDIKKDRITLPDKSLSSEKYCAMLIHQACYATAHKERLNRNMSRRKEELCCMIAAVSVCDRLQLQERPDLEINQIRKWMLQAADRESFFIILKKAKSIIEYLMELCPDSSGKKISDYDLSQSLQNRISKAKKGMKGDVI